MDLKLPYVQIVRAKGKKFSYYRRGHIRTRINGPIGSLEWLNEYERIHIAADNDLAVEAGPRASPGSFKALWIAYQASPEWERLALRTKQNYGYLIDPLMEKYGDLLVAQMPPAWIKRQQDAMAATPSKANSFLAVLRLILQWSIPRGWIKSNPTLGMRPIRHRKQPHRPWSDAEIEAMTQPGNPCRIAILVGLYTAQRLGDVLSLPWSIYDGQSLEIMGANRQRKTGAELSIPVHPELRQALEPIRAKAGPICTRPDGQAWKVHHFNHVFTATRRRLALPEDLHFHGLRHSAVSRLADAGCSHAEIAAITGHKNLSMVTHYSAGAQQKSLAQSAMSKLPKRQNCKTTSKR
jgi:integrase